MKHFLLLLVLPFVGGILMAPACTGERHFDPAVGVGGGAAPSLGGGTGNPGGAGGEAVVLPPEDCLNGEDDDQDGKTDEKDSECEACSPAVPEGWTGPMHFFSGAPAFKPTCDMPLVQGGTDPVADDLSCSACACGASGTMKCTLDVVGNQSGMGHPCQSTLWPKVALGSACYAPPSDAPYVYATPYKASGVTCTPSGGAVSERPIASFATIALGCSALSEQANCGTGNFIRPESPPGYSGKLCVSQIGDVPCPETYPEKSLVKASIDDQRECTKCTCASDLSCSGTLSAYSNTGCTGTAYGVTVAEGFCFQNTSITEKAYKLTSISYAGGCKPSEAVPEGALTAEDPVTVCCR